MAWLYFIELRINIKSYNIIYSVSWLDIITRVSYWRKSGVCSICWRLLCKIDRLPLLMILLCDFHFLFRSGFPKYIELKYISTIFTEYFVAFFTSELCSTILFHNVFFTLQFWQFFLFDTEDDVDLFTFLFLLFLI